MVQFDPRNRSTYHAGILKVQRRFSKGMQFLSSYTWSKSLDYGGSAASGGGQTGGPQTVTNLDAGHGPSGFDVRHRLVFSGVYELPFGPGKPMLDEGVMGMIVGGWQLSSIATFQGGRPFNVNLNTGRQQRRAELAESHRRSVQLDNPDRALWFDPTAFVAPPANTYGDVGRGILYSPGQKNIDVSLTRRFGFIGRLEPDGAHRRVQPDQHAVLRLPERRDRLADGRPDHDAERRQPHPAARLKLDF